MSQIAKKADVGLGTAYNYYGSKEELFLIAGGTAFIFGQGIDVTGITNVPTLISALVSELTKLAQIERTVWRNSLSSLNFCCDYGSTSVRFFIRTNSTPSDLH